MSRALRRHHYQRLKIKAKRYYFAGWLRGAPLNSNEQCGFIARTQTPCSCYCCGNPRKHFREKTRQELMHTIEFDLKSERG